MDRNVFLSAFFVLRSFGSLSDHITWRCTIISELMINEQIRDKEVRLIGEDGSQLGIMSAREAYRLAQEAELDLFLEKGDKVKVTLRFRGREMAHMSKSKYILDDFAQGLAEIAVVDKPAKVEGRTMVMFLTAKR